MKNEKLKLFLFRFILLIIVFTAFEVVGYLGMYFSSPSFDFLSNNNYFSIRAMLTGNKNSEFFPRYLTVPYLGYIPYPQYMKFGVEQHNNGGYRGKKVPLQRTNKLRILCLGGSTTYGSGVYLPSETYPAQLEILLNNYINSDTTLKKKYNGFEVLNAGLEAGNSADELTQYLFKYRFYKPDMVIVHSGINDALLVSHADSNFQLDYSHFRRINFHLEPLREPGAWLLKSYFISFLSIRLFYTDFANNTGGFQNEVSSTISNWTTMCIDSVIANKQYEYYPFYRNTQSLFNEITKDSSLLIVLPPVTNNNSDFVNLNKNYRELTILNNVLSKSLCDKSGGIFVHFEYDSIKDPLDWIDDCHLNANGEKNKAMILLPHCIKILKQNSSNKETQ